MGTELDELAGTVGRFAVAVADRPVVLTWGELVNMAPKQWGAHDVPERLEELRLGLLRGVEDVIEALSHQGTNAMAAK
jgi:hypothetical protein